MMELTWMYVPQLHHLSLDMTSRGLHSSLESIDRTVVDLRTYTECSDPRQSGIQLVNTLAPRERPTFPYYLHDNLFPHYAYLVMTFSRHGRSLRYVGSGMRHPHSVTTKFEPADR